MADLPWVHSTWNSFRVEDEHHSPLLKLLLDELLLSLEMSLLLSDHLLLSTADVVVAAAAAVDVVVVVVSLLPVAWSGWSWWGLKDAGCERLRLSTLLNRSWAPLALSVTFAAVAGIRRVVSVRALLLQLLLRSPVG